MKKQGRAWMIFLVLVLVFVAVGSYVTIRMLTLWEFHTAVSEGSVDGIERFTESWWLPIDGKLMGRTALAVAAYTGQMEMLDILLEAGARPEAFKLEGLNGMQIAAAEADSEIFFKLLATGATFDVNGEYPRGESLLGRRISLSNSPTVSKNLRVVKYLIEHGADVNYVDADGNSIVYLAVGDEYPETLRLVCEAGANPNVMHPALGIAPLHDAISRGEEWVRILIEHGADPNVEDASRLNTPLDMAKAQLSRKFDPEMEKVVKYLESLETVE